MKNHKKNNVFLKYIFNQTSTTIDTQGFEAHLLIQKELLIISIYEGVDFGVRCFTPSPSI